MINRLFEIAGIFNYVFHEYEENDVLCGYEMEGWTEHGVNMFHFIDCRDYPDGCVPKNVVEELRKISAVFSVDEEVDRHREDPRYCKDFTCRQSVEDFETYEENLLSFVRKLSEIDWDPKPRKFRIQLTATVELEGSFVATSREEAIAAAEAAWHSGEDLNKFFDEQYGPTLNCIDVVK